MAYRLPSLLFPAMALAATAGVAAVPAAASAEPVPEAERLAALQCATADIGDAAAKAAFAAELIDAVHRLERFDPQEAALLLERIHLCCDLLAGLAPQERTLMAARLGYAARLMAEHEPELARELDRLMDLCGDRVIDVNYGAARGANGGGSGASPSLFGGSGGGGGGVPSDN